MSNLQTSGRSSTSPISFLEHNPSIYQSLLEDCDQDFSKLTTIVEPILQASERCGISSFYIQAVATGRTAFLTTNLANVDEAHVTEIAPSWLIGRSPNCAVTVRNPRVSRCHAVIGYCTSRGFYITDVGSSNGTFVNRRRLAPLERRPIKDGDLLELTSEVRIEFFVVNNKKYSASLNETQV